MRWAEVRWLAVVVVVLGAVAWTGFSVLRSGIVRCRSELVAVDEPAGWHDWPTVEDHPEYVFDGTLGHPRRPFYEEIHLGGPGICHDGVLSLDSWINSNDHGNAAMYHQPYQLSLRRDPAGSETKVVVGRDDRGMTSFVAAFRRKDDRWAYLSSQRELVLLLLLLVAIDLEVAMARAVHSLREARDLARKPARPEHAPSEVYRASPETGAPDPWQVERDALARSLQAAAARTLRRSAVRGIIVGVALGLATAVSIVLDELRHIN